MSHQQPSFRSTSYSIFILLVAGALLLSSCGARPAIPAATPTSPPASPTPMVGLPSPVPALPTLVPPMPTATPIVPTVTPVLVMATSTPVLANNPQPLNQSSVATLLPVSTTPAPTATATTALLANAALAPAIIGSFTLLTGTTAGVIQGSVQAGQVLKYSLTAGPNQPLTLIMDSPNNDVTIGFLEANNNPLLDPTRKLRAWQMVLPANEQYTLEIIGGASTENFTLTVKLPLPVAFAAGATSTTLTGTTVNGYLFSYALNCAAGQTMTASLAQPASTATIDIYGIITGTLVDASAGFASWSGILPSTQDYVVEVVPANNQVVNYTLTVSCTGTPGNIYNPTAPAGATSSNGGSLFFRPGETMTVVQGSIQPGQIVTYSVSAKQYQPLMLILGDPNDDLSLGVLDPNGHSLLDPADMYTYWQWQLPMTGNYTIQVVGGLTTENFILTTKVGKLYTYPADGTSIKIYATTLKGLIKSYAFRLSAGVVMTVSLNVPSSTAYLDVFGVQTGSLLNASDHATTWTGTMPSTQEYVVEVIPGNAISANTLTISNP